MKQYGYPFSPGVWEKALETHTEEELRTATPKVLRRIRNAALIRLQWDRAEGRAPVHCPDHPRSNQVPHDIIRGAFFYQIPPKDRYKHERICDNCGTEFCVHIRKGWRIPEIIECPNCGCGTPET